jgi:hypothetical protein
VVEMWPVTEKLRNEIRPIEFENLGLAGSERK